MALYCEKGVLLTCRNPIVEQCSYCGKHFCVQHGHVDKVICNNADCLKKYASDLRKSERQAWEDERYQMGLERNTYNLCGYPECPNQVYVVCGHCDVFYCPNHVQRFSFTFKTHTRRAVTRVKGDVTLCDVCQPYLKEYNKDRWE